ncbi:MAG: hypothetical protein ACRDO2_14220 [Nocardioidaceae bacterium]
MSDDELRTALQKLAEPVSGSARPATRDDVIAEVERRTRRRWLGVGATAASVAVVAVGATIVTGTGTGDDEPGLTESQADTGWTRIADSPLSPRSGEVAVWTGSEMLVIGGTDQPPCPPLAECTGPTAAQRLSDGAAYNPQTDTWRRIAEAPQSVTYAQAVWTGDEAIVVVPFLSPQAEGATLAYDPETDRWRLMAPPLPGYGRLLGGGNGDPIIAWRSEERGDAGDAVLNLEDGTWTELPDDPFGRTYDRSFVWAGDRLLFTAMLVPPASEDDGESDRPRTYQLAELDLVSREWRVLPETPVGFGEPTWFVTDDSLVNPTQDWYYDGLDHSGGIYDLRTGTWRDVQEPADISGDQTVCDLPKIGVGAQWIAGGYGSLVSVDPDASIYVASCAPLHAPQVGVWAGDELIVYGGVDQAFKHHLTIGLRWRPPAPE